MLIVQPSPTTDRRAKNQAPIIFKLPPPPPPSSKKGNKEKIKEPKHEEIVRILRVEEIDASLVAEGNDTILSNEYTNLDDSEDFEEMTIDFPDNLYGTKPGHGMESDSNTSSEGGYIITDRSDSLKKALSSGTISLDNSLNLSLNSNSNNSNDSATELGAPPSPPHGNYDDNDSADELGAPPPPPHSNRYNNDSPDELGAPPPPPEFDHTPDSSMTSSVSSEGLPLVTAESETTPTQTGSILLLSYKPGSPVDESTPSLKEADIMQENTAISLDATTDEEQVNPISVSRLNELDEVVSDLRELLSGVDSLSSVEETTLPPPITMVTSTATPPPLVAIVTSTEVPIAPPPPLVAMVTVAPPPPLVRGHNVSHSLHTLPLTLESSLTSHNFCSGAQIYDFLKAHKKLYKMVCLAQNFRNRLILAFSPTYIAHGFLPKLS